MQIRISLPELELGELLTRALPAGVELRGLELDERSLRVEAHAPLAGAFALLAEVRLAGAALILSGFRVEGGMLARAFLGAKLTEQVAALDWRRGALHAWGEPDGERLHLTWSADSA